MPYGLSCDDGILTLTFEGTVSFVDYKDALAAAWNRSGLDRKVRQVRDFSAIEGAGFDALDAHTFAAMESAAFANARNISIAFVSARKGPLICFDLAAALYERRVPACVFKTVGMARSWVKSS